MTHRLDIIQQHLFPQTNASEASNLYSENTGGFRLDPELVAKALLSEEFNKNSTDFDFEVFLLPLLRLSSFSSQLFN